MAENWTTCVLNYAKWQHNEKQNIKLHHYNTITKGEITGNL